MAKKNSNPKMMVNPSGPIPSDPKRTTPTLADMASGFTPPPPDHKPPVDPAKDAVKHAPKNS